MKKEKRKIHPVISDFYRKLARKGVEKRHKLILESQKKSGDNSTVDKTGERAYTQGNEFTGYQDENSEKVES